MLAPLIDLSGDRGLLRVAVQYLVGNPWKYSPKRETARTEFGTTVRNGKSAYYVGDIGAGFDRAYANKLFGAF